MYPIAEFVSGRGRDGFDMCQEGDKGDTTRNILQMTVDGKRNRGQSNLRSLDLVKEDNAKKPDDH